MKKYSLKKSFGIALGIPVAGIVVGLVLYMSNTGSAFVTTVDNAVNEAVYFIGALLFIGMFVSLIVGMINKIF